MANFYKPFFLKAFFLLLLGGCETLPTLPESPDVFALKGKVAVRNGDERFTASLIWAQSEEGFDINLWGPMGQGRVHFVKTGDEIVLVDGQGRALLSGDPQQVMRERLGWSLPLDVLPAWVQGRPLESADVRELTYDQDGRVTGFKQLDWVVALERYASQSGSRGTRTLPTRITAQRGDSWLRLVVSEWQI